MISANGREATRRNNLDALRLVFAAMVMLFHAGVLSAAPALKACAQLASPGAAVDGFFVISGFLIFQSYHRSRTLADYASKRARRILPAYIVVILIIALGGAFVSAAPFAAYFGTGLIKYLAANLVFLNFLKPAPPGLFVDNPVQAADGALWTIKVEVMFYVAVPILVWLLRRLPKKGVFMALYLLSYIYYVGFSHAFAETGRPFYDLLAKQLPGQMSFFLAGAAIYHYEALFLRWRWLLTPLGMLLVILVPFGFDSGPVYPAALAAAVMGIGFGPYLGNAGRFGDLSYGLYIWHFPILQLLVRAGLFSVRPWTALALGTALSITMAFLSWHVVEKPFLRRSSHYRKAADYGPESQSLDIAAQKEVTEGARQPGA